ncbi:hypothetical protein [Embleya sp. AB8]|uniref:SCO2583/SCO2584 N-terminal domain-containing protein n=1 Tax=Embleya sp. AB8 TaxID=3156304 RepID=UPI003C75CE7C
MADPRGDSGAADGPDRTDEQTDARPTPWLTNGPLNGRRRVDPRVFDEDFVRDARYVEGSARARMLTTRLNDPAQADEVARQAARPRDFRYPKRRYSPRRLRLRRVLKRILLGELVFLLLVVFWKWDVLFGEPSVSKTAHATRAAPFTGSPAVRYADNEAGLPLPEARAIGGHSASAVANALELTRKLLIAGNLDRDVLAGGWPTAYLALLDPEGKSVDQATAALRDPASPEASAWVTRFDPNEIEVVGTVVKVTGGTTYETDGEGTLIVHADYSFVYPVTKVGSGPGGEIARVVVRRSVDTKVFRGPRYTPSPPGRIWLGRLDRDIANNSCTRRDAFLRPTFTTDAERNRLRTEGPAFDPYDRSEPIKHDVPYCQRTTGT